MDSPGREPRDCGSRSREAAEQRRRFHRGMTSLLRSSNVLCADDLRFHRRLPHTAALRRIAHRNRERNWVTGTVNIGHLDHRNSDASDINRLSWHIEAVFLEL